MTRAATAGRKRRSATGALAVAAAFGFGGCTASTSPTLSPADEPGTSPLVEDLSTSDDIVGWDDGKVHLVVATANVPGFDPTIATDESAPSSGATGVAAGDRDFLVVTSERTKVLTEPPANLVPVAAADADEERALAHAGPGSFIAVDPDGVVGEPGGRYVRTLAALHAIDIALDATFEVDVAPGTGGSGGDVAPIAHDPAAGGFDDLHVAERIALLDGVIAVEAVGPGILAVTADDAAVGADVLAVDGVLAAHPDIVLGLTDDARQGEQWAIANTGDGSQAAGWPGVAGADTDADLAWEVTTGAGTVVAVVDSGVELGHSDLADNIWRNPSEVCGNGVDDDANGFVDDCHGWDFGGGDADPNPEPNVRGAEHGTHVAGIIAAARNGGGVVGLMPDALVMPLKIATPGGGISSSSLVAAINYAVANGADVVNLSLGTALGTLRSAVAALEQAISNAHRAGVVVVAAMGNDGVDVTHQMTWPAGFSQYYDNVLAIGASTNSDTGAYFSNTGSPLTMYAPGWAILSSMPGDSWDFMYGTSMATPMISAAAAGVLAAGTASTPTQVRDRLVATGHDIGVGRRLDLAEAVGYEEPTAVRITMGGADRVLPDTEATLDWMLTSDEVTDATAARFALATNLGGQIGAVEGVTATFTDGDGSRRTLTSDELGRFDVVSLGAGTDLAMAGARLTAALRLPEAEYAIVIELVDDDGATVSPAYASYLSVAAPTTSGDGDGSVDDGGSTDGDGGAGSSGDPVTGTTLPSGDDGGGMVATPTTDPAGGDGSDATSPTTTVNVPAPDGGSDDAVVTVPSIPEPGDGSGEGGGGTADDGDGGGEGTTDGTSDPVDTIDDTTDDTTDDTSDDGGAGGTGTIPPQPDPGNDGDYSATSMWPRVGSVDGGTFVTIDGIFPTEVPVYVWFGDLSSSVVRADASATQLTFVTPAVPSPGVRDVVVKFTTDRHHEIRLADAFSFVTASGDGASDDGSSNGTTGDTNGDAPDGSTDGAPDAPPTTRPTTGGETPGVTTPAPVTGGDSGTVVQRKLGDYVVNGQPAFGGLSKLSLSSWPAQGCRADACIAVEL